MTDIQLQNQVMQAYHDHITRYPDANRAGALAIREGLEHSPLYWNGTVDKTVHVPKVFCEQTIQHFQAITDATCRIFSKVAQAYREQADYRALFPFSQALEDLILLPTPYESAAHALAIARFDLFYHEDTGDFMFCEINTDGTAAMLRDLEMRKALIRNPAHQAVRRTFDLEPFDLFDTFVQTFLDLYNTYPKRVERPNIAIVDFLENATMPDFEEFARRFQDAGVDCEILDIRAVAYRDHALYDPEGRRIDAVYRRAVTADVLAHYDEVGDFLSAVREDAVFYAGAFATQLFHSKWIFHVLHHERTLSLLTPEEREFVKRHVPRTERFAPGGIELEEVIATREQWILKPMDAYASKGVYAAGRQYTQDAWETLSRDLYDKGMICQAYCPQYLSDNIDYAWGDGQWHPYIQMPGLYVYNGTFQGILMRMACGEQIIQAHENERTAPVFILKGYRK